MLNLSRGSKVRINPSPETAPYMPPPPPGLPRSYWVHAQDRAVYLPLARSAYNLDRNKIQPQLHDVEADVPPQDPVVEVTVCLEPSHSVWL